MALHVDFCALLGNTGVNVIHLNKEGKTYTLLLIQ